MSLVREAEVKIKEMERICKHISIIVVNRHRAESSTNFVSSKNSILSEQLPRGK